MTAHVEPRVRDLVAEHLGVDGEELTFDVSLVDELAADSLDIIELALALESRFAIALPEALLDGVRTYGDLVELVHAGVRERREAEERAAAEAPPTPIWARVLSPRGGPLQRAGWLTPYAAQEIVEDALRAGPGARLEVSLPSTSSDARVASVTDDFAWLGSKGIQVSVRRDHVAPGAPRSRPHAA